MVSFQKKIQNLKLSSLVRGDVRLLSADADLASHPIILGQIFENGGLSDINLQLN